MCKETQTLTKMQTPKHWREVYYDQNQQAILLDTQDGLWMITDVTRRDLEDHILKYGSEGTDYVQAVAHAYDKYEGRSFPERDKELTVDIDDWLEHYISMYHSNLLQVIP
jgi:hypothetical protein